MKIELETDNYEWVYDSLYGVGRFIRKSDGAMTLLETGMDCQDMRERVRDLSAPVDWPEFDKLASQRGFT